MITARTDANCLLDRIHKLRSLPYKDRLDKLELWSLEARGNHHADLMEVFKMVKGLSPVHGRIFSEGYGYIHETRQDNGKNGCRR